MSAGIERRDSLFGVGARSWHGEEVQYRVPPRTWQEGLAAAEIDQHGPISLPVYDGSGEPIDGWKRVADSRDRYVLHVCPESYTIVTNRDLFETAEPFMKSGRYELDFGGSLRNGRVVFVLLKRQGSESEVLPGDTVQDYLLFSNSHNGTLPWCANAQNIRTVCQNTMTAAIGDRGQFADFRLRHTQNIHSNIDLVQQIYLRAAQEWDTQLELYQAFAKKEIRGPVIEQYFKDVWSVPAPTEEEPEPHVPAAVDTMLELAESGQGTDLRGVQGTVWGAYNAVTEYLTHARRTRENDLNRIYSNWFGDSAKIRIRAASLATKLLV